jgi:hypothetical protein
MYVISLLGDKSIPGTEPRTNLSGSRLIPLLLFYFRFRDEVSVSLIT